MPLTKEYWNELYNTTIYLAGHYAPDIEVLINTINSGNKNRGVFSIKPYWFDPDADNKLCFINYFCEKTGLAAPDAANYFFKLFCARLIVMAFYTIYLQKIFKRLDNSSIQKHMLTTIEFGWGVRGELWTIDSLMEAGDAEFGLELTVKPDRFTLGIEHRIFIRLDNKYLLNTATLEDTVSGNMPVGLEIAVEGNERNKFKGTITMNQIVQQIKAFVPFWQNN